MEPLISIIVPVYNVELYLDKCIGSIVDQTYKNLEIILVDDGSPDKCPQMCDWWASKDPRIKVIHQANAGLSAARNTGIKLATGEFLAFVDSDDTIFLKLFEKVIGIFNQYPIDIVTFNCERVTEQGNLLGGTETLQNRILDSQEAIEELIQGKICDYAWNKMYRINVFDGIWFPEGRVFEDAAVMYKVFLNANAIYTLNEKLYYYLQRSNSIVATLNIKKLEDLYLARKECYDALASVYPDIAAQALSKVALCAIRLYDRSLWEKGNEVILTDAEEFLKQNKKKILSNSNSITYHLFFCAPKLYDFLRKTKHTIGGLIRRMKLLVRK